MTDLRPDSKLRSRINTRVFLLGVMLLAFGFDAVAQAGPEHSPYYGLPIVRPAQIAGPWETSDGKDGAIGMIVTVITGMPGPEKSFVASGQTLKSLDIGLYRRSGQRYAFNWFSNTPGMTWDGRTLRLHYAEAGTGETDLKLSFHADTRTWTGRFRRDEFDREVVLRRPVAHGSNAGFVGTWVSPKSKMERNPLNMTCIHVVALPEGGFSGWEDRLMPYDDLPDNDEAMYGRRMQVLGDQGTMQIKFNVDSPVAHRDPSMSFRLSTDGKLVRDDLPAPFSSAWIKAEDDCSFQGGESHRTPEGATTKLEASPRS
jgi:hypothetical protein